MQHSPLVSIVGQLQIQAMLQLAINAPPGDFAEIGVFHGGTAFYLYNLCMTQNRDIHLFDTFQGTPYHVEGLDKHKVDDEFAAPEAPKRIRTIMPLSKLHIGVYPDTHPEGLRDIAFVHCDCDQYESYVAVIDRFWPILVPDGMILFDDYPYLAGAKKAVEERFAPSALKPCGARFYVRKDAETEKLL